MSTNAHQFLVSAASILTDGLEIVMTQFWYWKTPGHSNWGVCFAVNAQKNACHLSLSQVNNLAADECMH